MPSLTCPCLLALVWSLLLLWPTLTGFFSCVADVQTTSLCFWQVPSLSTQELLGALPPHLAAFYLGWG